MWFEKPEPITGKAQKHFEVSFKKNFEKEFGSKRVAIKPKRNAILHFSISDVDIDKFTDLVLVQFRKEYGVIDITISRDEKNLTVIEIPRENAIQFHDYILSKNPKFGADVEDLKELIEIQEDTWEKPTQGIDTRLRVLR